MSAEKRGSRSSMGTKEEVRQDRMSSQAAEGRGALRSAASDVLAWVAEAGGDGDPQTSMGAVNEIRRLMVEVREATARSEDLLKRARDRLG